jgi:serine protease Do
MHVTAEHGLHGRAGAAERHHDEFQPGAAAEFMRGEEIEYGLIGVKLERPTDEQRHVAGAPEVGGAVVLEVELGLPASGNLVKGDIVTEFAKTSIKDVDQLIRLVGSAPVGKDVEMKVYREGRFLSVSVRPTRKQVLKGVHREAAFAWRGMKLAEPSSDIRASFNLPETVSGVVVTHVESNTAAEKAGLKPGFVIRQLNDEPVKGLRRLRELANKLTGPLKVRTAEPEQEITLP